MTPAFLLKLLNEKDSLRKPVTRRIRSPLIDSIKSPIEKNFHADSKSFDLTDDQNKSELVNNSTKPLQDNTFKSETPKTDTTSNNKRNSFNRQQNRKISQKSRQSTPANERLLAFREKLKETVISPEKSSSHDANTNNSIDETIVSSKNCNSYGAGKENSINIENSNSDYQSQIAMIPDKLSDSRNVQSINHSDRSALKENSQVKINKWSLSEEIWPKDQLQKTQFTSMYNNDLILTNVCSGLLCSSVEYVSPRKNKCASNEQTTNIQSNVCAQEQIKNPLQPVKKNRAPYNISKILRKNLNFHENNNDPKLESKMIENKDSLLENNTASDPLKQSKVNLLMQKLQEYSNSMSNLDD